MQLLKAGWIPIPVYLILANICFERYAMGGTSAILTLYLNRKLNFDKNASTAIFHTSELLSYLFPIVGAVIADSWWGHFKTVLWMLLLFSGGSFILALGAIETLGIPMIAISMLGLFIVVIGSGSIRASLTAFAGNQYRIPDQKKQLATFFSLQMFAIKLGSFVGRFTNPIIRDDVQCFGMEDCYPIAFGTAGVAMAVGFLLILFGKSSFTHKSPGGNMFVNVCKCMLNGISEKFKRQKIDPKNHWLDYAEYKHGAKLVAETKNVINILVLYLPLPVFWAVYQLQGSRWVFQAENMNGDLGIFSVKPDQMIALNPLLGVLVIPLSEYVIYPALAKVKITTLLQKMTIGGILTAIAAVFAGLVQIQVEKSYISMMWLVPQYVLSAFSENFLYNSHLSFAYNEAPASMKSVMTSFVFVVIALGNAFVIIVSGLNLFKSLSVEFFFFAGFLTFAMIIFGFLATKYEPVTQEIFGDKEISTKA